MNRRQQEFERDQRYASLRDRALRFYLFLRASGMSTEDAWGLARSLPVSSLESTLRP